jgi:hypothetical protein
LPVWIFALIYVVLFLYVLALLWLVPPAWPWRRPHGSGPAQAG